MKKNRWLIMIALLAISGTVAWAKIGTGQEVATALGISLADLERIQAAVGTHQKLTDDQGSARVATVEEAVAEMVARMNDLVLREEGKTQRAVVEAQMLPVVNIEAK